MKRDKEATAKKEEQNEEREVVKEEKEKKEEKKEDPVEEEEEYSLPIDEEDQLYEVGTIYPVSWYPFTELSGNLIPSHRIVQ